MEILAHSHAHVRTPPTPIHVRACVCVRACAWTCVCAGCVYSSRCVSCRLVGAAHTLGVCMPRRNVSKKEGLCVCVHVSCRFVGAQRLTATSATLHADFALLAPRGIGLHNPPDARRCQQLLHLPVAIERIVFSVLVPTRAILLSSPSVPTLVPLVSEVEVDDQGVRPRAEEWRERDSRQRQRWRREELHVCAQHPLRG